MCRWAGEKREGDTSTLEGVCVGGGTALPCNLSPRASSFSPVVGWGDPCPLHRVRAPHPCLTVETVPAMGVWGEAQSPPPGLPLWKSCKENGDFDTWVCVGGEG